MTLVPAHLRVIVRRHVEKGARLEVIRNRNITLDLDTPDDLELLKQIEKSKA
jgi:hypothetical protein